jgi:ferredoxin
MAGPEAGKEKKCFAKEGQSLLELAHENDVDLEGETAIWVKRAPLSPQRRVRAGACEGSLACSTCHVILPDAVYHALPEPTDEENDMLDLAFGLTETCVAHEASKNMCWVLIFAAPPRAVRDWAARSRSPRPWLACACNCRPLRAT